MSTPITLDFKQATELLEMFGGEPGAVQLQICDGHSGRGLYAWYEELPEEGAVFLGLRDDEALPVVKGASVGELTPDLIEILGTPNFATIGFAQGMRAIGVDIPRKAEAEQAHMIHFMLRHYVQHGADWRKHAAASLDAMEATYKATKAANALAEGA